MGDCPSLTFSLLEKVFAKGKMFWYFSPGTLISEVCFVRNTILCQDSTYTSFSKSPENPGTLLWVDIISASGKEYNETSTAGYEYL